MRLGLMLEEEYTFKLTEMARQFDVAPLKLVQDAIDTMYKAWMDE